jgi:hypothetical protein
MVYLKTLRLYLLTADDFCRIYLRFSFRPFQLDIGRERFIVHRALFIVHRALFIVHRALFIVHRALFIVHRALFIVHNRLSTLFYE